MDQAAGLVLTRLVARRIDVAEATLLLALSERSARRLRSLFITQGPDALVHGNTGRRPVHALDPAVARRVVAAANDGYAGLTDTHLSELLAEDLRGLLALQEVPFLPRCVAATDPAAPLTSFARVGVHDSDVRSARRSR